MHRTRVLTITVIIILSLFLVGMALAADFQQETNPTDDNVDVNSSNGTTPVAAWPGPDGFGYKGQITIFDWVDITTSGTPIVGLADDNYIGPLPMGFSFNYYGSDWTEFYASSNGFLTFGTGATSLSNQCPLPNMSVPDDVVAMLWDDLNFNISGSAYYQYFDTCPVVDGRCTVVEYYNVAHYGGVASSAGTWETIFFEDGNLLIQFLDSGSEMGAGSTTGMENADFANSYGLTYACNTGTSITDNLSILFTFPIAPNLIDSTKIAPTQVEVGDPIQYTMKILNTGVEPAYFATLEDQIPVGTIYTGNVTCSSGECGYDSGLNTIYWSGSVDLPPKYIIWRPPTVSTFLQAQSINSPVNPSFDPTIVPTRVELLGTILLNQAPNQSNGFYSDVNCEGCSDGTQVVSENFLLESPTSLEQIIFWTGYLSTDTPLNPDTIRIIIHEDTSGLPGAVVYDEFNVSYTRTQTGVILFGIHEYEHTLTLGTPALLAPGVYWVEIYNDTGLAGFDFFWETGDPDTMGRGLPDAVFALEAPGLIWHYPLSTDLALQLIGNVVEQPTENPVIITFSVTQNGLYCGDTVYNEATINDPQLVAPVVIDAFTEVINSINYSKDFEANSGAYQSVGINPWSWGPPPEDLAPAHSGVNVWATESPYIESADYQLISPLIDLNTVISDHPLLLQWWQKLDVEEGYDYAYVDISTDGVNWNNLWSGNYRAEWERIEADITSYIGESIYVRFELISDYNVNYLGWVIDDVAIVTDCNPPDIEVIPSQLDQILVTNQQGTQQLALCNMGDQLLNWNLSELLPPIIGVQTVLWDNGPLVTHPGGGFGGADVSSLQSVLALNTYGFGAQVSAGYRMADDFEINDPAGWNIQQITFFAYQTLAPTNPSPIAGIYYQIWDGPPDNPTSNIVFGDLSTNRLISSNWSQIYRALDTSLLNTDRAVLANVASAGVTLPPGTYWFDWTIDGSASYSGPWVPPITILGQTTTGNALHWNSSGGAWTMAVDTGTGTQQGIPFVVEGEIAGPPPDLLWLSEDPLLGTVEPGICQDVDVTFDSTGLDLGLYTGALKILSNDPYEHSINAPVSLTVVSYYNFYLPLSLRQ